MAQYKDKSKPNQPRVPYQQNMAPTRVRTPRENQVLGVIEQRVGANRMIVKCLDGKERNCRIPGALRRKLWIRPGDTVMVEPWEFEADSRGDVVFKYTPAEIDWLKKHGFIREVEGEF